MMRLKYTLLILCCLVVLPGFSRKKKTSGYEPLLGKSQAAYQITSSSLKGATFYLVSGHGGPDPGCIGKYRGKELHEDTCRCIPDLVLFRTRKMESEMLRY